MLFVLAPRVIDADLARGGRAGGVYSRELGYAGVCGSTCLQRKVFLTAVGRERFVRLKAFSSRPNRRPQNARGKITAKTILGIIKDAGQVVFTYENPATRSHHFLVVDDDPLVTGFCPTI